ncbi:hypothetical protein AWZ03_014550 [Drosophila navojoa]|uniref:Uncharacterized protein n=1 Tax=Drosophila navojoa TaxID=7232 RepID=A0A484ARN6_DRONA|nr:hypothetical protein AWZ03_014550 [Drosophila navojoa]
MKWLPNGQVSCLNASSSSPLMPAGDASVSIATTPRVVYWQNFNQKNYNIAANYLRQCRSLSSSSSGSGSSSSGSSSSNKLA